MLRLLVVGGGRMGSALIGGLLRSGWATPSECAAAEVRSELREEIASRFPGVLAVAAPVPADDVVLAVKPGDAEAACAQLRGGGYRRVVSIVAGVTIDQLESWLWPGARVIRTMPNTAAVVGASASAIAGGSSVTAEDLAWAESVLASIGVVVRLPERLIDSATGLSGSGPAYVFLVAEALVEAGVLVGLDREVSRVLTVQTLLGSARLLAETGEPAEALRAAVTSPGGTTAAGLRALEERAVRAAFLAAVSASAARAGELGSPGRSGIS